MKFLIGLFLVLNTVLPAHGAATRTVVADQIKNSTLTNTYALPALSDTLVGRTSTDTLTNKTLTSPVISTITNTGTLTLPTATTTLVGRTTTETLTNKTLTSPTLTTPSVDIPLFTDQSSTPGTPAAGKRKLYSKTTGKFYQLDSSGVERELGSGGTGVNFVTGGDAEGGSIWATYADAAGTTPVDGTGGVPTITSATTSSSSPLSGANSFLLAHPASNTQGNGWSYDFSIDIANKAKVLNIEFDYLISSGTFVSGSPGVDSDIIVYIYDVTNATLIQPSSYKLLSNNSSIADHFSATFQTASNSTSYRLILHSGKTTATAFTIKLDSLKIGPSNYVFGTPITDWVSYTPTLSNATNATVNSSQWRRVGDSIEGRGFITWSGVGGGAGFTVSIPSNYIIDTAKLNASAQNTAIGYAQWFDNGTARKGVLVTYNTTSTVAFEEITASAGALQGTGFASGDTISYSFHVPISGLSSSVQMSDQDDSRVVLSQAQADPASTTLGNIIIVNNVQIDTHGAYNTSTGRFTCPISGYYKVHGAARSASTSVTMYIYKNAVAQSELASWGAGETFIKGFSGVVQCNSGDFLDIRPNATLDLTSIYINYERLSGPSAISATESYNFRYTNVAGTALTSGSNTLTFATKDYDSHGSWVTNTFTPQIGGKFNCSVKISVNTITGLSTNYLRILVAGSTVSEKALTFSYSTASPYTFDLTDDISVTAGQAVTFVFQNGFGSTINMDTGVGRNSVACKRVGN